VLYVSPSVHKNGHPYEIIGPCKDPVILDDFIDLIDNICRKYNIPYLDAAANNNSRAKIPIEELFKDDFTVQEGHNRHEALLRVMESLIARNIRILALDEIREFAKIWNDSHCSSPLDDREFQKQWKCATAFIDKKASAEKGDNKYKSKDETLDLADELRQKFHFKTVKVIKDIYYFDSRRYVKNGNIVIESELEARYLNALAQSQADPPKPWTRKKSDEIIGQVEQRTYVDISAFDADMEWLACDNCMLNLRTGQTAPFSPSFMNTTCIPVKYSDVYATGPAADFFRLVEQHNCNYDNCQCPKIMKFLHDIVEPEDVEILLDFIAYCLWRDYKYAHWLLLNGYGQNGKSVLLNLIELFLGKDNTSAESLERLLKEKFAIAISEVS
jgi:hypothetical protein